MNKIINNIQSTEKEKKGSIFFFIIPRILELIKINFIFYFYYSRKRISGIENSRYIYLNR